MDRRKDRYFRKNACSVMSVELFWGLGFPIVMESTFLQIFLKNMGASSFLIGIVPSLFVFGTSCFPLFAGYLTRNIRFKKKIVMAGHLIPAFSIFTLGAIMFFVDESRILPLFFFFYTIFSLTLGLAIPIWLNFIVRIFSSGRTVAGFGYMMLAQNIGKIISSFFILKVVEKYAFSTVSCAAIFTVTGALFITGSLFFINTMELADENDPPPDSHGFIVHTRNTLADIFKNRPFLIFLAADLDFYVIITVMSFYANYATDYFGTPQAVAAGVFVGCIYAGSVTVNIFLGTLDLLKLKQKFLLSKLLSLVCLSLLILVPGGWSFFIISFILGMVRAIRNMVYSPSVKKISGKTDATSYFSFAPILTIPFGFGFPLLFGRLLDSYSYMGANAYRLLFAASFAVIIITLYFTVRTRYPD